MTTTLATLSCPNCSALGARELEASRFACVLYLRCGECAHVWTADKQTKMLIENITPVNSGPTLKTKLLVTT